MKSLVVLISEQNIEWTIKRSSFLRIGALERKSLVVLILVQNIEWSIKRSSFLRIGALAQKAWMF